jgi:hypothetical protein
MSNNYPALWVGNDGTGPGSVCGSGSGYGSGIQFLGHIRCRAIICCISLILSLYACCGSGIECGSGSGFGSGSGSSKSSCDLLYSYIVTDIGTGMGASWSYYTRLDLQSTYSHHIVLLDPGSGCGAGSGSGFVSSNTTLGTVSNIASTHYTKLSGYIMISRVQHLSLEYGTGTSFFSGTGTSLFTSTGIYWLINMTGPTNFLNLYLQARKEIDIIIVQHVPELYFNFVMCKSIFLDFNTTILGSGMASDGDEVARVMAQEKQLETGESEASNSTTGSANTDALPGTRRMTEVPTCAGGFRTISLFMAAKLTRPARVLFLIVIWIVINRQIQHMMQLAN